MATTKACLHHMAGKCTATLCRWQDSKDALHCTVNGVMEVDRLSARLRNFSLTAERFREELKGAKS